MKKIIIFSLCFFVATTYGQEDSSIEKDPCKQFILFQPQATDMMHAAFVFNVGLTSSACSLKDKINLNSQQYLMIYAFSKTEKGNKFKYKITTFHKGTRVTEQMCETESHFEHPPGSSLATYIEVFSTPICSEDVVIQK